MKYYEKDCLNWVLEGVAKITECVGDESISSSSFDKERMKSAVETLMLRLPVQFNFGF